MGLVLTRHSEGGPCALLPLCSRLSVSACCSLASLSVQDPALHSLLWAVTVSVFYL